MKKFLFLFFYLVLCSTSFSQSLAELESKRTMLPNGWALTPFGADLALDDLPLNLIFSPNKKLAAISNCGQSTQSIQLIDVEHFTQLDRKECKVIWYGLAFSDDSKTLYASGGNGNYILQFDVSQKTLQPLDTFVIDKPWPNQVSIAGIALEDKRKRLYAVSK